MQIHIINLATQPERWSLVEAQFSALGLKPCRLEAQPGGLLTSAETQRLYSERLNRRQYHKALSPGEIGCYASHLAAWQRMRSSNRESIAVFEDDIDIDPDLPQVLDAIEGLSLDWDVIKLMGRTRERVLAELPLVGDRRLVEYARVPSRTGAYVLSRRGADKLLARRVPFGRPVDVDLRHWWECDLDIFGVASYPVRPAAGSQVSSITDRHVPPNFDMRVRKLSLQLQYTLLNWHATRVANRGMHIGGEGVHARAPCRRCQVSLPWSRPALAAAEAPRRPRNLVVVRAGDNSLHEGWLGPPERDFDLFISYYGASPGRYLDDAEFHETRTGPKWPGIAAIFEEYPSLIERYQNFWFPDDDLAVQASVINRMFAFFTAFQLSLAQPALTPDSFYTWKTLIADGGCFLRFTRFVEVMAPVFDRSALKACIRTFSESPSGWGLDWVWPTLCDEAGLTGIAVIDATPVRHTRPVGGELYKNNPHMNPRADAARIIERYGLQELRAVAKYSAHARVRTVDLSPLQKLLYWLKKLNGRRRLLRGLK